MLGLIGGTGLGEALLGEVRGEERVVETPFGPASGPIRVVEWEGIELAILARHGEGHVLPPSLVPYRANIYALKSLGVTHVIASGAVGSLRDTIRPRDLVIVDQLIDKTCRRPATFFDMGLAVHVEMAQPYCRRLRELLLSGASEVDAVVHPQGTYVCMEGPAFSTAAESHMHRAWGADLIGMTALPEAKLAREAEMCYALIALVTDFDCWKPHEPGADKQKLMEEIISNLKTATANAITLMRTAIEAFAGQAPRRCECQEALALAIWSDRAKVTPEIVRTYGPLLSKYFKE